MIDKNGHNGDVPPRGCLRVLLVDDNPVNQKAGVTLLSKIGYRADVAANGLEAIEAIGRTAYDVILMDCEMPVMDGYEATLQIRLHEQEEHRERTCIIAVTSNMMPGNRERCLAAGMDDYMSKPMRATTIQQVLERIRSTQTAPDHVPGFVASVETIRG